MTSQEEQGRLYAMDYTEAKGKTSGCLVDVCDCGKSCLRIATCCELFNDSDLTAKEKEFFPLYEINEKRKLFEQKTRNMCYIFWSLLISHILYIIAVFNILERVAEQSNSTAV